MTLLEAELQTKSTSAFRVARIQTLKKLLVWHLRMHTVPETILKCYSTVELKKVRSMFGAEKISDAEFKKLLA